MTQCNTDFLAEITRFLQADELGIGFPTHQVRPTPSVVVDKPSVDTVDFGADSTCISMSSSEEEESSWVVGNKRPIYDRRAIVSKRPQRHSERTKNECEELRREAAQLSKRLSWLMQKFKKKNNRGTSGTNCLSTWKTIARCLQIELQEAEYDRYRLQRAVESQNLFIRRFYGLLLKQLSDDSLISDVVAHQSGIEQQKDDLIFAAHVAELDVNYECTDGIFSSDERLCMGGKIIENSDSTAKCMESRDKHKYPFNFDRSRDSIWKLFRTYNQQKDLEPYTDVTNPDNTNAFKFRMLEQLTKETTVSLLVRVAMRRYLTGNQIVIVWRTFTEGEGIFNGVHCSESGWTRARPCEKGTTIEMYFKLKLLGLSSMTARFHDAASLFREIAQGRKARILNGLASFPHDKNLRTRVEPQTKSRM